MERRRLPVGIQTLGNIRARNCYYVDKTPHVLRLVGEDTHYFLSRPRRFGKSLLVDTLKELFEGNGELFRGLAIHGEWDWSVKHPVVRISFGGGEFGDPDGVREEVADQLEGMAAQAGVEVGGARPAILFRRLVRALRRKAGRQVVVLVDEYDKPILDALTVPEVAQANREFLRSLYGGIKDCDADIRFCFLTGVSKFSKAGLFSGLNNLRDITLSPAYGTICGYTDDDLDAVFAPELEGLDRDAIRRWYNGYNWLGEGRVYNPFDILLLFRERLFRNYWFETGTPAFLIDLLARRGVDALSLEGRVADDTLLSAFDVDRIEPEALLFQTGYLTITGEERDGDGSLYTLGYPNQEVRRSLNAVLLGAMVPGFVAVAEQRNLHRLLQTNDFAGVEELFRAFLAGIPNEWYARTGDGGVRGALRERVLLPLRGRGDGRAGRGEQRARPGRHGGAVQRQRICVRVQTGGPGTAGPCIGPDPGAGLCGQVPRSRLADPSDWGGVRPGGAEHRRLLGRGGLNGGISGPPVPPTTARAR